MIHVLRGKGRNEEGIASHKLVICLQQMEEDSKPNGEGAGEEVNISKGGKASERGGRGKTCSSLATGSHVSTLSHP